MDSSKVRKSRMPTAAITGSVLSHPQTGRNAFPDNASTFARLYSRFNSHSAQNPGLVIAHRRQPYTHYRLVSGCLDRARWRERENYAIGCGLFYNFSGLHISTSTTLFGAGVTVFATC